MSTKFSDRILRAIGLRNQEIEVQGTTGARDMIFHDFVNVHKPKIYELICRYIPKDKEPRKLYETMRDYIDRQGKYARPGLLMLVGMMYGAKAEELYLPAAAQQLSEDWILMQDDWEDDSELRRGKPTAHRIYGAVRTVNATNLGQLEMWHMLADYRAANGKKGDELYRKFNDMMVYTVEGQEIENEFIHETKDINSAMNYKLAGLKIDNDIVRSLVEDPANSTDAFYMRIVDSKTCFYTVYGPMQLGAIAAGHGDARTLQILKEIGTETGIAFQIIDDVLDMIGDEAKFGKKNLGDLYEGKITLMVLHAYKNSTPDEKSRMDAIYKKKRQEKTKEEVDFVAALIEKYKGIEYAKKVSMEHGAKATALIEKYKSELPQNEYASLFVDAVQALYKRDK